MTSSCGGAGALAAAVALGIAASGCGAAAPSDGERFPFIAFGADFVGFRAWPSQAMESPVAQGSTHVSGTRTVFINALPPADAVAFPVGTIIVKETQADAKVFARVKRGGGYNATGAVDWEWFELEETSAGAVVVIWHGVGPPAGETYGGDPNSGCNTCHKAVPGNDYVLSPWLKVGAPAGAADSGGADGEVDGGVTDAGDVDGG